MYVDFIYTYIFIYGFFIMIRFMSNMLRFSHYLSTFWRYFHMFQTVLSLLISIFDVCSRNTEPSNGKTVWKVFFIRNFIFLYSVLSLYNDIQVTKAICWIGDGFFLCQIFISMLRFTSVLDCRQLAI